MECKFIDTLRRLEETAMPAIRTLVIAAALLNVTALAVQVDSH